MGEMATGGASASSTGSSGTTVTLPQVTIANNSLTTENDAQWDYSYLAGSSAITSTFDHTEQVVYVIDRSHGVELADFSITLSLHVSDSESSNTSLFDDYVRALTGVVGTAFSFDSGQAKRGTITIPAVMITIPQPPAPC
jgi:hypothetical protein